MYSIIDALKYVKKTGYVPWANEGQRTATEEIQSRNLIEFVPNAWNENRRGIRGWRREGRYILTDNGLEKIGQHVVRLRFLRTRRLG